MEYTDRFYLPLHSLYIDISKNNYEEIKNFMIWKNEIKSKWQEVKFINAGTNDSDLKTGDEVDFFAEITTGDINLKHISLFVVIDYGNHSAFKEKPKFYKMKQAEKFEDKSVFRRKIFLKKSGKLKFMFVLLPSHKLVQRDFESDLAKWY